MASEAATADRKTGPGSSEERYIFPFTGSVHLGRCQVCDKELPLGEHGRSDQAKWKSFKGGDRDWTHPAAVTITCLDPTCAKVAGQSLWKYQDELGTGLPLHRIKNWCLGGRTDAKQTYVHFSRTEKRDVEIKPITLKYLIDTKEWGLFSYHEGVKRFSRWGDFLNKNWEVMLKTMYDAQQARRGDRAPPPVGIMWPREFPAGMRDKYQAFLEDALEDLYMFARPRLLK
jgi:hypothetical protein